MYQKMKKSLRKLAVLGLAPVVMLSALSVSSIAVAEDKKAEMTGKELAFNRKKGNCLACHAIEGGKMAGEIGPALVLMSDRFTKEQLKAQIFDAQVANPDTLMPPFGKHKILSEKEIDKVVEFISSL